MKFNDIFARKLDRHLDGVIKWDATDHLASELDEYVFTPEIQKNLQLFCDEYTDPQSSGNGVWISGFYGSGKSHLLKILAYLVENPEVSGKRALDWAKPHLKGNPSLLASLERVGERIPSRSILFNIGAKSDSGVGNEDAVLSAFIKVLNERCGYVSSDAVYLAGMERELDREGLLERFVEEFNSQSKRPWLRERKSPMRKAALITRVYDHVVGNPEGTSTNIVEHFASIYHPSVEDFAGWAEEYIKKMEKDEPGFRLNFFVDEVGQFIAKSDERLFTLQNVAEALNTQCHGRAWLYVVSQEDMDDIVGEVKPDSSYDFSKIQARFKLKMKIPSNDANTVVRDRLLAKNPDNGALEAIDKLYDRYNGEFKMLFGFPNGAKEYDPYHDCEEFEAYYPLVPYQFTMFHKALTGLAEHNCFTGEYTSTGARNMLGATRKVLLSKKDTGVVENGDLVSFDMMFDGLYQELKSEVFAAVSEAEEHLHDKLGVRILKALLLVKYNDDFTAKVPNLRTLLYQSFTDDPKELEERIAASCRELESQHYIRRKGDAYEYLTSEEKDVEAEIGHVPVDDGDICKQIGKFFAEDVVDRTKVTYVNGHFSESYSYDVLVDGRPIGAQRSELKLNIITALTPDPDSEFFSRCARKTLVCLLPQDDDLIREARIWLQTKDYIGTHIGEGGKRAAILSEKQDANQTRWKELKERLSALVNGARWATDFSEVTAEVTGSGAARVESACLILVKRSYPHLSMLRSSFDSKSIYKAATDSPLMTGESMPGFADEVLVQINRTLSHSSACFLGGSSDVALERQMGGGEHGWPAEAVRQGVALLSVNGKVQCMRNDEPLEGVALAQALSSGKGLDHVSVKPARNVSPQQLAKIREARKRIVGVDAEGGANQLADGIIAELKAKYDHFSSLATDAGRFPFSQHYREQLSELGSYSQRKREWVVQSVADHVGSIVSVLDDLGKMAEFAQGSGGASFRKATTFLSGQAGNISACGDEVSSERAKMEAALADPECYRNSSAPKVNRAMRMINEKIAEALDASRGTALADLDQFASDFRSGDYASAPDDAKAAADTVIDQARGLIESSEQIQYLQSAVYQFKKKHVDELNSLVNPPAPEQNGSEGSEDEPEQKPTRRSVMWQDVASRPSHFYSGGGSLESPEDVDSFVSSLGDELKRRIESGESIVL